MKKKFLKNLAFALAAATVISSAAPAVGASAAAAPSFNKKAKNLYLNNDAVGKSFDFNINNKVKGSTYKWTSSNTKIATVNNKNGVVTGKKVGTVKITCKITLPTKKTKTLTATVNVKKNATGVAINNVPENKTIGIGSKAFNFNRNITDKDATDKTFWIIDEESNTAGATVNTANGVVTTTKAGEFKITAYTYQNNDDLKAKKWTATSETATIKVVPSLKEIKQAATTKITATFDDNMSKSVNRNSFDIVNSLGVKQPIKDVTFSEDGKQVTIETYVDYNDKETYKVTYDGKTLEFVASKGEIASVAITPKTIQYSTQTEFDVHVFDANGIELVDKEVLKHITYDYDQNVGYIDTSDTSKHKLTIYNYDKNLNVKATYHTYKYANNKEITVESPVVTFNSVKEIKNTMKDFRATVAKTTADWSNINKSFGAESSTRLFVEAKDQNGKSIKVSDMKFSSTDNSVLQVTENNGIVNLYGAKAGSAHVKVEYGDTYQLVEIVVTAKSKANSLSLNREVKLYADSVGTADLAKVKVKVKVLDQFGNEMDAKNPITAPTISGNKTTTVLTATKTGDDEITFELAGEKDVINKEAGTYTYLLTHEGIKSEIRVTVYKTSGQTAINNFKVESDTDLSSAIDVTATADSIKEKSVDFKGVLYNQSGYKIGIAATDATDGKIESVLVRYNGDNIANSKANVGSSNVAKTNAYWEKDASGYKLQLSYKDGDVLKQAAAGEYLIEMKVKINGVLKTEYKTITVKNTQAKPDVSFKDVKTTASNLNALINDVMEFTLNGNKIENYTITKIDAGFDNKRQTIDGDGKSSTTSINQKVTLYGVTITAKIEGSTATEEIEYAITGLETRGDNVITVE